MKCSSCGLLVCAAAKCELGDCPACLADRPVGYKFSWWQQELPVGPFRRKEDSDAEE